VSAGRIFFIETSWKSSGDADRRHAGGQRLVIG
jgi:hypothetical protein